MKLLLSINNNLNILEILLKHEYLLLYIISSYTLIMIVILLIFLNFLIIISIIFFLIIKIKNNLNNLYCKINI